MRGRGGRRVQTRRTRTVACAIVAALVGGALEHGASPTAAATASGSSGLSAFALLDAAGYASALGEPVLGVEDDGAIPNPPALVSQARSATTSGIGFTITLSSFDTSASARQVYSNLTRSSAGSDAPTPIAGGDSGSYAGGHAVVLKKSQVLDVKAQLGGDVERKLEMIKEQGGDPTVAAGQALMTAATLAAALATHMTGQSVAKPKVVLAKGAIDPCVLDKALKAQPKLGTVSTVYSVSERPPATECQFRLGKGLTIDAFIVTTDQLAAATPPTDIATVFAADKASATGGSAGRSVHSQASLDFGPNIFTQELPEPTAEIHGSRCLARLNIPGSQLPVEVSDADIAALERFLQAANRQLDRSRRCRDDLQRAIESQGDPFTDFKHDIERMQNLTLAELLMLAGAGLLL